MDKKLIHTLLNLGLSENEALVYLGALSLGSANATDIARAAGVKRTTVYNVIEMLKHKGLISQEIKGFKEYYIAEHPNRLKIMLENKNQELRDSIPAFLGMFNLKGSDSTIKYYEGEEAMKLVYEDILANLKRNDFYLAISDTEKFQNLNEKYFSAFLKKRTNLFVQTRLLLQDSALARERKKFEKNVHEQIKILPPNTDLVTNMIIIPDRIIIHQLVPPINAIVITNPSVIQMGKQVFEIIWNSTL